jgi:7-cyano-7-deazaguanine synthase
MPKAVSLMSGGMDSTTLAYMLKSEGYDLHLLSFDYGQRHLKELVAASKLAEGLEAGHDIIILSTLPGKFAEGMPGMIPDPLARVLSGSSLTDESVPVPDGHYAEESMRATVVPNRNAIMLSIAYGVAVAEQADLVAFGAHAGDHAIYPDCRPEFVAALGNALVTGNRWDEGNPVPNLIAPFLDKTKTDIAVIGQGLGVPWEKTWTCYKGGAIHCGRCGTCVERREAFRLARVEDPTPYEDNTYDPPAP